MRKRALGAIAILILSASVFGQGSAEETMRRFCKMDFEGGRLTAEGERQAEAFMHLPRPRMDPGPPGSHGLVVVSGFEVKRGGASDNANRAWLVVDYTELGRIDASVRFSRSEGRVSNKPTRDRQYYSLELDDSDGPRAGRNSARPAAEPRVWRIVGEESRRWAGIAAAIRYVSGVRDGSSDPAIRANAERTVNTLRRLAAGEPAQATPAGQQTPRQMAEAFLRMDGDGAQLTPGGRQQIASLFAAPGPPRDAKINVVKECGAGDASIADDNTAAVRSECILLGDLDPESGLYTQFPQSKGREDIDFILAEGTPARGSSAAVPAWKIKGPIPRPGVSVATALRYVTALRARTTSPIVRRNAGRALASLRWLAKH